MHCNLAFSLLIAVLVLLNIVLGEPVLGTDRPPYQEYAKRARYIVNRANWTVVATFSFHDPVTTFPYARVESCSDGLLHNGTGTPYLYLMKDGTPMQNLKKNGNATLSYSEAEFGDIQSCMISPKSDPENPLCSRVMLYGQFYQVTDKKELQIAQKALFTRHPFMKDLPASHQFQVYGLKISHIGILDYFGGAVWVDVDDYYNA